jgi:hypothetical protein
LLLLASGRELIVGLAERKTNTGRPLSCQKGGAIMVFQGSSMYGTGTLMRLDMKNSDRNHYKNQTIKQTSSRELFKGK